VLLLVSLSLAAGCGGSSNGRLSKPEYQAKLRSAFTAAQSADSAAHRGGTDQVKTLKAVAAAYGGLASALGGLRTPVSVQPLNDELVAGASAQAKALAGLVAKLEQTPQERRSRVLAEFDATRLAGQREFEHAVAALEARGYRFRTSAGT
jgi:hypothetical protein